MSDRAEIKLRDLFYGEIGSRWYDEDVQLLRLPNIGRKSVATIRAGWASRGLQVGQLGSNDPMDWYLSQLGDA